MIFVVPNINFQKPFCHFNTGQKFSNSDTNCSTFWAPKNKVDIVVFVVILETG